MTMEPAPRRRGAPLGNKNALKHGFYTRGFKKMDLAGLDTTDFTGLKDEIMLIRFYTRRVVELGKGIDNFYDNLDILRVLCMASDTLTRLLRTQHMLSIGQDELSVALRQALDEVTEELHLADPGPFDAGLQAGETKPASLGTGQEDGGRDQEDGNTDQASCI